MYYTYTHTHTDTYTHYTHIKHTHRACVLVYCVYKSSLDKNINVSQYDDLFISANYQLYQTNYLCLMFSLYRFLLLSVFTVHQLTRKKTSHFLHSHVRWKLNWQYFILFYFTFLYYVFSLKSTHHAWYLFVSLYFIYSTHQQTPNTKHTTSEFPDKKYESTVQTETKTENIK